VIHDRLGVRSSREQQEELVAHRIVSSEGKCQVFDYRRSASIQVILTTY
jgi:hypothetical protein